MRSLLNNIVVGVSQGFEKKLELVGVGYRAQAKGKTLNLSLGFSHPVDYPVPEGITIETPSQTEVVVKGSNKQQVGQSSCRKLEHSAHLSHIKAKVLSTLMNASYVRKPRKEVDNKKIAK